MMATKKKGILTRAPQWWRHLRDWKRTFWKRERKAAQRAAKKESKDEGRAK
jgi:hypothetical protein